MLLHVGLNNYVAKNRVIAILALESEPIKRMVRSAREVGRLIDTTMGRRTRSVVVLDSGHVVLSAVGHDTLAARLEGKTV
jgi:regulator of extracellular matrix RemA (YlzA/DUF370 family)